MRQPGPAASRSATSACTMTSARAQRRAAARAASAAPARRRCTAGWPPAPWAQGRGASVSCERVRGRRRSSASARSGRRCAPWRAARRPARGRSRPRRRDAADLEQAEGQRAEARTHLEHDVVRAHAGAAHDRADGVGVDDEVLPQGLGRPDAERAARSRISAGPSRPSSGWPGALSAGRGQSNRWLPQVHGRGAGLVVAGSAARCVCSAARGVDRVAGAADAVPGARARTARAAVVAAAG